MSKSIVIKGGRENNLKNINLELPRNQLIVMTGVSGSGKSSLAFDIIYMEGRRRYIESLSNYARQFLGQMKKPDVDYIGGLSPAISIEQKTTHRNPRSTVGTVTEIYDYLRLLYARCGVAHCSECGDRVASQSIDEMVELILEKDFKEGEKIYILAPVVRGRKGGLGNELEDVKKKGFVRVRLNGGIIHLEGGSEEIKIDQNQRNYLDVVVDRLILKEGVRDRLVDSIEVALGMSGGFVSVMHGGENGRGNGGGNGRENEEFEKLFSEHKACHRCGVSLPELEPNLFSFNSPNGACGSCHGLGEKNEFDEELLILDSELSIFEGGLVFYSSKDIASRKYLFLQLRSIFEHHEISYDTKIKDLTKEMKRLILYGFRGRIPYYFGRGEGKGKGKSFRFEGLVSMMWKRYAKAENEDLKRYYESFMKWVSCHGCGGERLRKESLGVKVGGRSIMDVTRLTVRGGLEFFEGIDLEGSKAVIGNQILKEIRDRYHFLNNVGLGYLSLDRKVGSLSGGEMQRIRLASQIGSQLSGVLYVLDEPSIGLHQRDNQKLLNTLKDLRDLGNTLIVVEHDEETMLKSDYLVDLGPGAGVNGGEVVALGTPGEVVGNPDSLTGKYLKGDLEVGIKCRKRIKNGNELILRGCTLNNLKDVTVKFPLSKFIVVTGVSGSGKSTLINDILYPTLDGSLGGKRGRNFSCEGIEGFENVDKIVRVDQSPIGRTPRSNPATYTGVFTLVRELFSEVPEAKMRGYKVGRFSFNVKGGRCESCFGDGTIKIEMHFLPDVYVKCDVCQGRRYNRETLEVRYAGKNISEVLELDIDEGLRFFENIPGIYRRLKILKEVGLGYVKLGQNGLTLSGGEAQRLKLAKELSKKNTGRTIYLLDEPTTGLHFDDVRNLVEILNRIVENGNTVIVIEHQLDVVKLADHIIDLGPEGGSGGGEIIFSGVPKEIMDHEISHTGRCLKQLANRLI